MKHYPFLKGVATLGCFHGPWEPVVPRIPDAYLECVVYIYPNTEAAQESKRIGGTGFLVGVTVDGSDSRQVIYVVTNSHVAVKGRAIRLNTLGGGYEVIPVEQDQWFHHAMGDDIAVLPIKISPALHRYQCLSPEVFLTRESMLSLNVGQGDDVFFMGRFITHEGKQQNTPVVRFGSIAMMPGEPVHQTEREFDQESFLIEARSLSGFSGSPVMLYIPPFSHRFKNGVFSWDENGLSSSTTMLLLGVDWGTMHLVDGALTNSGIMGVVPVWKLGELLESDDVVEMRRTFADVTIAASVE